MDLWVWWRQVSELWVGVTLAVTAVIAVVVVLIAHRKPRGRKKDERNH